MLTGGQLTLCLALNEPRDDSKLYHTVALRHIKDATNQLPK